MELVLLISILFLVSSAAACNDDLISFLPGQPPVNFRQYAGQIPVNREEGRALFYWFFEAEHPNASSLPVVLWLNGGPGCSSVGYGLLSELGPFRVNKNGTGLLINEYSWTKAANMIFMESPAGVGFAYSNSTLNNTDSQTAKENLKFLTQWFKKFPHYKHNDFYIVGESYAGHYIPTLAMEILSHNKHYRPNSYINFKGFAIGNAFTDLDYDGLSTNDFYYTHSMISDETYATLVKCGLYGDSSECNRAFNEENFDIGDINPYSILEDDTNDCITTKRKIKLFNRPHQRLFDVYDSSTPCKDNTEVYLNRKDVQDALHVNHHQYWQGCSDIGYKDNDMYLSMLPLYKKFLSSQLRIWIYSGDMDSVVPTSGSRAWLKSLKLTTQVPWYPWNSTNTVAGWSQVYKGLTFVTVRGAGHMVPSSRPKEGLQLFQAFLNGQALPKYLTPS